MVSASRRAPGTLLSITALNELGYGVGQKSGQTLTVARTAPGDKVLVGPPAGPERWSRADLVKVVEPGPDRVLSECEAFEKGCGGCQWLHLSYPSQLEWKERNLTRVLRERAGFRGVIHELRPLPHPDGYRNKLSLKNQGGRWYFIPETGTALSPRHCRVQTPALQAAWSALRTLTVPAFLEQLHLRSNDAGQVGIHAFVHEKSPGLESVAQEYLRRLPGAIGWGASTRSGYRVVAGESVLVQTLGALQWAIPHNGFFQTNALMAAPLLDAVREHSLVSERDRVLDLYCGAGFFGLAVADRAAEVVGIDDNASSIAAAQESARRSGLHRARFLAGDVGVKLDALAASGPEIVIVDPPRTGLSPQARSQLIARRPRRIVYVSCYPATLARDLGALHDAGWRGVSCTPLDMFPHTSHVEVVVVLERSDPSSRPSKASAKRR